jgi:hypothetical protein
MVRRMRQITMDPALEAGDTITVEALDADGPGGASHAYRASWPEGSITINFQRGPRKENNHNGLLEPALLVILQDRLERFQAGPYASDENAMALEHIKAARAAQCDRARARLERGVLGTTEV